jgi:hypothetical protein
VHVRTTWTRDHNKLSGTTNDIRGEKHTVDGTLDGKWGTFQVTEKDAAGAVSGHWTGVFLSTGDLIARWASPDGTSTWPVTLDSSTTGWDYPPRVSLRGGGTITPVESYFTAAFYSSSAVAPSFAGLPVAAAESSLNVWSRKTLAPPTKLPDTVAIVSAWDETTYSIAAQRAGWVALDVQSYMYWMGGTHGFSSTACSVVDLDSGRLVNLVKELPQAGRTALVALTRQTISKDPTRPKNESLSYVTIDDKRPVCVIEEKGALFLDIVFGEDDGFYVMAPEVHIAAGAVRPLFPPGSVGAKVFQ